MTAIWQNQEGTEKAASPQRILYFVTEDWFFVSHFLGMARAARDAGHIVGLATRLSRHRAMLEAEGFHIFPLDGNRGSLAFGQAIAELRAMNAAIQDFSPDILHLIAMRAIALGGLLGMLHRELGVVVAPTGLGYIFASRSRLAKLARSLLKRIVASFAASGRGRFVFENAEDPPRFRLSPRDPLVTIIGGAGVDGAAFPPAPQPAAPPVKFALVARMLRSKGILTAIDALRLARASGEPVELHLYGDIDPGNPHSLSRADLDAFAAMDGVHWHGYASNIAALWADHHGAILLSEREGMPRSLAEAAASARPIIASDVTGCREIVLQGVTGYLVPKDDAGAGANAILRLARDEGLRRRMGEAGRAHFETRFTLKAVSCTMLSVYADLAMRGRTR